MSETGNEHFRTEDKKDIDKFFDDQKYIHYIGMISPPRPGVALCLTELEHTHYPPGSPKNDNFLLRILKWSEMVWVVVSIPISDKHLMEEVASKCGLRIANGVPTILSSSGDEQFPVNNERVFTLENKSGHPAYHNDPQVDKTIKEAELSEIEKIDNNWKSRN